MKRETIPVAVIGAGPYGLALAAHLGARGVGHRIFGTPMGSWRHHMPAGMFLKSEGFASTIASPGGDHTLERYCADHGLEYGHTGVPVPIETFSGYGTWFQEELVPNVEDVEVRAVATGNGGFVLRLADGEAVHARRVVVASGIRECEYIPDELRGMDRELVSRADHTGFGGFAGRTVAVIGAGQSALETAALLHEAGARTHLLARIPVLDWSDGPPPEGRSIRERARRPGSGLGNGWRLWGFEHAAAAFRRLPAATRLRFVRETLGPQGAWWLRPRFGGVEVHAGTTVEAADPAAGGGVTLRLRRDGGARDTLTADHVIAGTGFRPDVRRLSFLSPGVADGIRNTNGFPVLDADLCTSVPGLHMIGLASAGSFGPVCRFVVGAGFAARRLSHHLAAAA